jgi:hypothetical protein
MWGFAHLGKFRSSKLSVTPQKGQGVVIGFNVVLLFDNRRRQVASLGTSDRGHDAVLVISRTVILSSMK